MRLLDDVLEMRSHPFSHPEQFVFGHDEPVGKGKGKAPMLPEFVTEDYQTITTANPPTKSAPERKYFTRATPTGAPVSTFEHVAHEKTGNEESTAVKKAEVKPPLKKSRFSFIRKAQVAV